MLGSYTGDSSCRARRCRGVISSPLDVLFVPGKSPFKQHIICDCAMEVSFGLPVLFAFATFCVKADEFSVPREEEHRRMKP